MPDESAVQCERANRIGLADQPAGPIREAPNLHDLVTGPIDTLRSALSAATDLEARDEYLWTPLMLASGRADCEAVAALIEAGADIAARAEDGATPLLAASTSRWVAANGTAIMGEPGTPGTSQPTYGQPPTSNRDIRRTIDLLLEAGADVEASDYSGFTPLMRASFLGLPATIRALLDSGANLEARAPGGLTPLQLAIALGPTDNVRTLIDAGANVESRSDAGHTPLMIAHARGASELVELLLAAGATRMNPARVRGPATAISRMTTEILPNILAGITGRVRAFLRRSL